jgi:hypothetical protein
MSRRILNTYQYAVGTSTANAIGTQYTSNSSNGGGAFRADRDLIITNLNSNVVYFGSNSGVTTSNGAGIPGNTVFTMRSMAANVYVITGSTGSVITVAELI